MNLEVANRLQQLRKAKGLSQEELAQILGLSRQAISKWERAETSPDTDNLICLARLYNISIDKLLDTSESTEEIKERIAQERIDEINNKDDIKEEKVEEASDNSDNIIGKDEEFTEKEKKLKKKKDDIILELVVTTIVVGIIACIMISESDPNWWRWAWIIFVVPFCIIASFNNVFKNPISSVVPLILGIILFGVGLSQALESDTEFYASGVSSILLILMLGHIILNKVLLIVLYFKNKKDMDLICYKDKVNALNSAYKDEIKKIIEQQKKSQ